MVVKTTPNDWTQLNSNANNFIFQNLSVHTLVLIASDTKPLMTDKYELIIQAQKGMTSEHAKKIFWGRPLGSQPIDVGVVE